MIKSYINVDIILIILLSVHTIYCQDDPLTKLESTIISHGGQVLRITDSQYHAAAILHNRVIQTWPNMLIRPATFDDVSLALSTLSSLNIPIRIMGGRHSYGGYCSHQGIVTDSVLLKGLKIDLQSETVTMEAGVLWNDIYKVLNGSEHIIVGGLCPAVGVVGFTVGGGYNAMYSRSYGYASDNVLNFKMALYNGTIVTASSTINPDLYWALRGGGGGNFGFVLEMTQKIHRINQTNLPNGQYLFLNLTWVNTDIRKALNNWFTFIKEVVDFDTRISFNTIVVITNSGNFLTIWCSFNGPEVEFNSIFDSWLSKDPKPNPYNVVHYAQIDIARELAVPFPVPKREHVLSAMAINITDAMLDVILEFKPNSTHQIDAWTDFVYLHNANKDKNTAFAFPNISFDIAPGVSWLDADFDPLALDMAQTMERKLIDAAASTHSIPGAYLNYIDPYLPNWEKMYYRNNWERLREINTKYDPTWYFRFPQGIPPYFSESNISNINNNNIIVMAILIIILIIQTFYLNQ
ncbi:unnamed protein product [Adineta steineri]|uniref:FAD-binding PCMH-type domain-containing protein n=1 Tax=Adineta steineri TaxID=433720 RepID=A0A815CBW4_9BILA|nr:unnamed protein product [Adineta steineri]CAF1281517.1 unnamed protein product [Adineta steineri]